METKVCRRCKVNLPINNFGKNKAKKDGLDIYCKMCTHKIVKEYCENNLDKKAESNKKYGVKNKEKISKLNKIYRAKNKEHIKEYSQKYRKENFKYMTEWREKNKKHCKEYSKKYETENLGRIGVWAQNRNAIKLRLPSTFTLKQWEETKLYFDNKCCYCGNHTFLTQEHFIPLTKDGGYTKSNIIPACRVCNSSKNNKDFFVWYKSYKHYSKERENKILEFLRYKNENQQLTLTI